MNPTNSELKACPLCGIGKPVHKTNRTPAEWLECDHCGFTLGPWESTWNEIADLRTRKSEALADDAVERAGWPQIVAEALECFWNAAIGSAMNSQDSTALAISGSLAEGFAAMAARLRKAPATALSTLTPSPAVDLLREALAKKATWFRFDPATGEWTGGYCSVKPHDNAYFVPMVRLESIDAVLKEAKDA